jgi:hypothetical protein
MRRAEGEGVKLTGARAQRRMRRHRRAILPLAVTALAGLCSQPS